MGIPLTNEEKQKLSLRFRHHTTDTEQVLAVESLRYNVFITAVAIAERCPDTRERSLALTKLEEALFWANASIARKMEE